MPLQHPAFPGRFASAAALLFALPLAGLSQTPTRTTLQANGSTLTAQVQTPLGEKVSAGTVDFVLPSGQSLGSALVQPDGTAVLPLAALPAATATAVDGSGTLPITAAFTPSTVGMAPSASVATAVPAAAATAVPDFTLTGNPTTITTPAGSYGSTAITITSSGGYAGSIQFSCSGLPGLATCTFNPTQQALQANGSFTSTLQIQTAARSGTASAGLQPLTPAAVTLAFAVPGALFLLGMRRRRFTHLLGLGLLLTTAAVTLPGCSQRYSYLKHPPPVAPGTPAGTYSVTVYADGNQGASVLEHTLVLSLVVQ